MSIKNAFVTLTALSLLTVGCGPEAPPSPDAFFDGLDGGPADAQVDAHFVGSDAPIVEIDATSDAAIVTPDGTVTTDDGGVVIADDAPSSVANDTCAGAIELTPGTPLTGSTAGALGDYGTGAGCGDTRGPDVVYVVHVPANKTLTVTVTPTGEFDPTLALMDASCGGSAHACITSSNVAFGGGAESVSWVNTGSSTVDVYAVVDAYFETAVGAFTIDATLEDPLASDTCDTALMLSPVAPIHGTTVGAENDYGSGTGCRGGSNAGPDLVYTIEIPALQIATVTLTPTGFDATLNLVGADCGGTPRACLAGSDNVSTSEVVNYRNPTDGPLRVNVVVDGYGSSDRGAFDLSVSYRDASAGDTCDTAPVLGEGTISGSNVGANRDYNAGTGCRSFSSGADVVYAVDIPAGNTMIATLDATFDATLEVIGADCPGMASPACLASIDEPEVITYRNTSGSTLRVFVVVASYYSGDEGDFDLNIAFVPPAANDTCASAISIGEGTFTGSTIGASRDYKDGAGCRSFATGPDVVYAIDIPPGNTLSAVVDAPSFDSIIELIGSDCTSAATPACLASVDSGNPERLSYRNTGTTTLHAFIAVGAYSSTGGGTFTLTTRFIPPATNETCASAPLIGAGTSSGATVGATNDYFGGATPCGSDPGADVVYAIDVPAQNLVTVTLASGSGFDGSITLVDATCSTSPRTCLARNDSGSSGGIDTVSYRNTTDATLRIYAIVDSFSSTGTGTFDISVAFVPPVTNDTCGAAAFVGPGSYPGTTMGATNDYPSGAGCAGMAGADVVYAIDVPAGQRLTASLIGTGGFNPSLNLIAGPATNCDATPRSCARSSDTTSVDTVTWLNGGSAPRRMFVVVDSSSASASGTFILTLSLTTPAAGDACASAARVSSGRTSGTTAGFIGDYGAGSGCAGTAGPDRVYVVSVPAGQTLTAAVTPTSSGFDPSISLEAACGLEPRVCIAGDDSGAASATNTVSYTNTSTLAEDIFIVIDTYLASSPGGAFDLDVTLAAP